MFPLRINLLSPEKKIHLKKMTHFQFLKSIFEILFILANVIAIVLLGAEYVLQNYFSLLTENVISVNQEHTKDIREIRNVNKLLLQTAAIQKEYYAWSPLLVSIANNTPGEIILSSISFDYTSGHITLNGTAQTREVFLAFQEAIKTIPGLTNISSPLSGLTKPQDIIFTISADLDKK